ncbi:DUF2795 domain-containing protein [Thermopolyspora sp. NPDC052614]|uniref:DUF2795 domain-containing protein n=1 Tax=Thermopolyspora sp. NPDC052614 TaxID=3155682 RepID=UPI00341C4301
MERGSSKHGPRLDEQQKHETEGLVRGGGATHAEEWKQPEPMLAPAEEALDDGTVPSRGSAVPQGITPADVERRSNLAKWLSDARFPADRRALLTHAVTKAAPEPVLQAVRTLPDEKFHNVGEVATALGLGAENHR